MGRNRIDSNSGNTVFLVVALAGCVLNSPVFAESFLVKEGQPRAEIVIAEAPARITKLAASQLQVYIEKISGAKLPIVSAPTGNFAILIYVGPNAHTDRLRISQEGLKHGAFRMTSGENWLVLLGRDRDFTPPEPHARSNGDIPRATAQWDKLTGATWGFPHTQIYKMRHRDLGIWEKDERGSLNAVCEFLRRLGVRSS